MTSFSPTVKSAGNILATDGHADPARAAHYLHDHIRAFQAAIRAPERCHFPVIAAMHGHVIGLGVDMSSSCDVRYAAADASFSIKVGYSRYVMFNWQHDSVAHRKSI